MKKNSGKYVTQLYLFCGAPFGTTAQQKSPNAASRLACRSPTAALMVIFVQLCKRHLLQRKDQAVSSVMPID